MARFDPSLPRCSWCGGDAKMLRYHDKEWGVPVRRDRKLFEFLVLESAQAGLSWKLILSKRDGYREAFANFDPERVARFRASDVKRLLKFSGIIRNEKKIQATIENAKAFLRVREEWGSFSKYNWSFVAGETIQNKRTKLKDMPAKTDISTEFSKDLKKRGFRFLGPIVMYSHMQAVGMVNDHLVSCFRYKELKG